MEREILEQSEISQRIIDAYVSSDGNISIDLPQNINRIILIASGSSYHCRHRCQRATRQRCYRFFQRRSSHRAAHYPGSLQQNPACGLPPKNEAGLHQSLHRHS